MGVRGRDRGGGEDGEGDAGAGFAGTHGSVSCGRSPPRASPRGRIDSSAPSPSSTTRGGDAAAARCGSGARADLRPLARSSRLGSLEASRDASHEDQSEKNPEKWRIMFLQITRCDRTYGPQTDQLAIWDGPIRLFAHTMSRGAVAHMVERPLCMRKVRGSIPCCSKIFLGRPEENDGLRPINRSGSHVSHFPRRDWRAAASERTTRGLHQEVCFCPLVRARRHATPRSHFAPARAPRKTHPSTSSPHRSRASTPQRDALVTTRAGPDPHRPPPRAVRNTPLDSTSIRHRTR